MRKLGYYLTFLAGIIIFVLGIINILSANVAFLIVGSLVTILSPLWIKSPKILCIELKNPVRLLSTLIFLGFLIATIIATTTLDSTILSVILGICLALAGIWYFLSFFKNGQKACIAFLKACCGKEEQQEQQGETVEESA